MDDPVVQTPAGYVPAVAISYGADGATAVPVDANNPLPMRRVTGPALAASLAGSAGATAAFGPFTPELGRPIVVTLSGNWTGTVTLLRSVDGGATRLPLTFVDGSPKGVWTANVNTAVAEESVAGATYYLDFQRSGGTLAYRMEQ